MTYLIHQQAEYWVLAQSFLLISSLFFIGVPLLMSYGLLVLFIGVTVFRREFPRLYENVIKIMCFLIAWGLFLRLLRLKSYGNGAELQHYQAVYET
jgi:hypothetical protein